MTEDVNINLPELIVSKIKAELKTLHLWLEDKSHMHSSHNKASAHGNTHFFLKVVSDEFINLDMLQRHKRLNAILRKEYRLFHSLRISALTGEEHKNAAR
jgi:BolA protein